MSLKGCCQRRKLSENASCGLVSVYIGFENCWDLVWVGSFDGETSSSWDLAFYEEKKTLNESGVCDCWGEVFPS